MGRAKPPTWRRTINAVLNGAGEGFAMWYQPICAIDDARTVVGFEALARFPRLAHLAPADQGPDRWFAHAAALGLGEELEALAVSCAVQAIPRIAPCCYLSVNVSADTILVSDFAEVVLAAIPERIVVELTEHDVVRELEALKAALAAMRGGGHLGVKVDRRLARLAIDDVGAGHSGLARIIDLAPDILKLDRSIVAGVDASSTRARLIASMVMFTVGEGISLVAEGVETEGEMAVLRELGVDFAQGYLLGRPAPMEGVRPCQGPI